MMWTGRSEYRPAIEATRCTHCGRCHTVCPHTPTAVRSQAARLSASPDPMHVGLAGATCFLGWDGDDVGRSRSASGGVVTALLRRLFASGRVDAVVHAEGVPGRVGEPHVRAVISRSAEECEGRRSSFYHPVSNDIVLPSLLHGTRSVAVVGVPCTIRAVRALWATDARYRSLDLITIGLACSHNVNGQFIDFLAQSLGIDGTRPFTASLRNKEHIPDANNFNLRFVSDAGDFVTVNRNASLFTSAWRKHWFAMPACQSCADFWGADADLSVKDAWGPWAADPRGASIVAIRDASLEGLLRADPLLHLERLPLEIALSSQPATIRYKQVGIQNRLQERPWSRANRESGHLRFRVTAALSKACYRALGYRTTRVLLAPLLGAREMAPAVRDADRRVTRLGRLLRAALRGVRPHVVVCWGTGAMAMDVWRSLGRRIDTFVDSDQARQVVPFQGRRVLAPSALADIVSSSRAVVLIASMHDAAIERQVEALGLPPSVRVIPVRPLYQRASTPSHSGGRAAFRRGCDRAVQAIRRLLWRPRTARRGASVPRRDASILIVGGYGFLNAGDEAQLASTIRQLRVRFPRHRLKILTPNLDQTLALHGCQVGEAPRQAFYDLDRSALYHLQTRRAKVAFIGRSLWLLAQAWLVGRGWPVIGVQARRATLLHDLATAQLLVFCGGGYLTGRTLSRLWDGMFLLRMAHVLGTPAVLSGQTIGVWNSRFSRHLAKWGLETASVIATRDADKSPEALAELRLRGPKQMVTCDDALYMDDADDAGALSRAFTASGFADGAEAGSFVTFNAHYWGLDTPGARDALVEQLLKIVDAMTEAGSPPIVGVPMHSVDVPALERLAEARPEVFRVLQCVGDFRVARLAIGRSRICVSMKHHPVVFALGQGVPAISLALGDYYEHKNAGALGVLGQEGCNVRLAASDWLDRFDAVFRRVIANRDRIAGAIRAKRPHIEASRLAFFDAVAAIIGGRP